jgi:hypothetical protein
MATAPLSFSGPIPESPAPLGRRSAERFRVLVPGRVVLLSGEYDCALEDISTTGARIICDIPLRTGFEGILQCYPLDAMFSVAWIEGKSAGLQFHEPAALGAVRQLRWNNDCYRQSHDTALRTMLSGWMEPAQADKVVRQVRSV